MKKYKILEDIATADIAFESLGNNLNQLFENSALAVFDSSADIKKIKPKIKKEIKLDNKEIDNLLYDFLSEIVFLKDKDSIIFCKSEVKINKEDKYRLKAILHGEKIDTKKHTLLADIKAVTLHLFNVEKTKDGWKARVILDI